MKFFLNNILSITLYSQPFFINNILRKGYQVRVSSLSTYNSLEKKEKKKSLHTRFPTLYTPKTHFILRKLGGVLDQGTCFGKC